MSQKWRTIACQLMLPAQWPPVRANTAVEANRSIGPDAVQSRRAASIGRLPGQDVVKRQDLAEHWRIDAGAKRDEQRPVAGPRDLPHACNLRGNVPRLW